MELRFALVGKKSLKSVEQFSLVITNTQLNSKFIFVSLLEYSLTLLNHKVQVMLY